MGIWVVKTTLEIDDELYREAKAHASLTGQKMKDLVTMGLRLAMQTQAQGSVPGGAAASRKLRACFAEADQLMESSSSGASARSHLTKGRNRLAKS